MIISDKLYHLALLNSHSDNIYRQCQTIEKSPIYTPKRTKRKGYRRKK